MSTFNQMELSASLQKSLQFRNFEIPTPIQAKTIPLALQKKDILGSAQTGTGKTLAFAIPLLEHIVANKQSAALILTPTRELAQQVFQAIRELISPQNPINMAVLIGGEAMPFQLRQLKKNPRIIVGTPGRVIDHLTRRTLSVNKVEFLVLDEIDRMLDMGFIEQLDEIVAKLPKERQTLMFTATLPSSIEKIAQKYLQNPERVSVDTVSSAAPKITQDTAQIKHDEKYDKLLDELNARDGSIIVFVNTKMLAELLADKLYQIGHKSIALHGNLRQRKRDRVVKLFKTGKFRVLVATDVAARGLDIPHTKHVINYDIPQMAEDYIHRIGRTGRAGKSGFALSFVTPKDIYKWNEIERLMDPTVKKLVPNKGGQSNQKKRSFSKKPWFKNKEQGGRSNSKRFSRPGTGNGRYNNSDNRRSGNSSQKSL